MADINGDNGDNVLNDTAGDDGLNGLDGNDTITVTGGHDNATGGNDDDRLIVNYGWATSAITGGFNDFASGALFGVAFSGFEHFTVTTGSGNDGIQIAVFDGNDVISTGAGDDFILTNSGDDIVDGGADNDLIDVGIGNDSADGGTGIDRISANMATAAAAINWNLQTNSYSGPIGSFTNFEYMNVSTGSGNDTIVTGTGNLDDGVALGDGDDSVAVFGGNDNVSGQGGTDTLIVNYGGATTAITGGFNNFQSGALFGVAFTQFERFVVTTGSGNDSIGIAIFDGNDVISTGAGNDQIDTNSGDDIVDGGADNDLIDVGTGNDSADGGSGIDRISANMATAASAINWNLQTNSYSGPIGSFTNFEYMIVSTGSGNDTIVTGTGNLDDGVALGEGDDSVAVFAGNDNVNGLGGNDTLIVNYGGATTAVTGGFNNFQSGALFGVAFTQFERFVVTTGSGNDGIQIAVADGNDVISTGAGSDFIEANSGDDTLDGGTGADQLHGGTGDDQYFVDAAGDQLFETAGQGNDRVFASASYTLAAGVSVETLGTTDDAGTGAINLTGNELANTILGNAGANLLNGGAGGDIMQGFGGNDRYYLDNVLDRVIEASGGGNDILLSSVSYVLADGIFVEGLSTTNIAGTDAINLTGNSLDNGMSGNAGVNFLNGGGGADIMQGFGGDDRYYVDNALDRVIEAAGGGNDIVLSSVNYVLVNSTSVEGLATTNNAGTAAINLTGNNLDNGMSGNNGANILNGGAGADVMQGFGGNDRYYVDNGLDRVIEASGGGADILLSSVSFTITDSVFVESLATTNAALTTAINLTGNSSDNAVSGNAGVNSLAGNGGNDSLFGLGGNDNLQGGTGNDSLFGGLGADSLTGGTGTDAFRFDSALGGGNVDTITDFVAVDDAILIDNAVFTGLAAGVLPASAFRTGTAAVDADDRIIYNGTTGALLFDADGVGGVAAVQFATLQTGLAISAADFVVV